MIWSRHHDSGLLSRWRGFYEDVRALARAHRDAPPRLEYTALRESEALYRMLAESASDIIWLLRLPDKVEYVSPACERILGWSPTAQVGRRGGLQMLTDESAAHVADILAKAIEQGAPSVTYEAEHNRADGGTVWCEVHQALLYDESGNAVASLGITRDISETRKLRAQLTAAQKAEAVGVLAGGVAHDFNNFLTVIIGSLDLLSEEIDKSDLAAALISDAIAAAEKSAVLTSQLLGISRNQPVSIRALDVNAIVSSSDGLFDRLVGERINLNVVLAQDLVLALGDENQLQQILVNLVLNARDAIERDGEITVETSDVWFEAEQEERPSRLEPGRYVVVAVSDDGRGMEEEVRRHATEPFFSTKQRGDGTGLGLAMVQNITERVGGDLSIESEPGLGTTVKVYLPVAEPGQQATLASERLHLAEALRGTEQILIVEDEDSVRTIAQQILVQAGYSVHATSGPTEAIDYMATRHAQDDPIDLVLTDLVMPGLSGVELAGRLKEQYPDLCFVVMSGYADTEIPDLAHNKLSAPLVTKPFHANGLLATIRSALDGSKRDRSNTNPGPSSPSSP